MAVVVPQPRADDVWLVSLDPVVGSEIRKTRPCLIVSPDQANRHLQTVIVGPLTSTERPYPTRVAVSFSGRRGQIALDQLRTVDKQRLIHRLGTIGPTTVQMVSSALVEMFTR